MRRNILSWKRVVSCVLFVIAPTLIGRVGAGLLHAEDGSQLWLRYEKVNAYGRDCCTRTVGLLSRKDYHLAHRQKSGRATHQ